MKKISLFLIFLLLLSGVLISCSSDGGSSSGDDGDEKLVTHYSYNLEANETYYIVHKYESLDNGNNTYGVKKYTGHYFSKTNSTYSDKGGNELCSFVEFGVKQPTHKKSYTMSQNITAKST